MGATDPTKGNPRKMPGGLAPTEPDEDEENEEKDEDEESWPTAKGYKPHIEIET